MKMQTTDNSCHIVRRVDQQGTRPPVLRQAGVEKCATGCGSLSLPSISTETRTHPKIENMKIRIATINVQTMREDIKLAMVVKAAIAMKIDVLAVQEARRIGCGSITLEDQSMKGWNLTWSGYQVKHVHGVAFLLAPHVKVVHFEEHMPARLLSMRIEVGGMKLNVLNVYAPCDSTKSESTKNNFYNALNKAKLAIDGNPKYKKIVLGDYNATISSSSKESGAFDGVLGINNSNGDETNEN